ncbi:MAG: serine/threonine-protein kinase, partial [Acidobacteriota bacterium]
MKWLSDKTLDRLREAAETPDLTGTPYRIIGKIARGGMGAVFLAEDSKLDRRVAIKITADPSGELARRLAAEARIIARLEHPGIVPVHDAGTLDDGRVFYVMKHVEGDRLDEHVKKIDSLSDRLRIFQKVCEAVSFAHARGVLHRDLKPENIMVGQFGEALVMEWGVAKILRDPEERDESDS